MNTTLDLVMHQHSYVGKRADKFTIDDIVEADEDEIDGHIVRAGQTMKVVSHYTMTCSDCGGDGRYDDRGEVICEDCGFVVSGDRPITLAVDYDGSRGFSNDDPTNTRGHSEPMI